MSLEFIEKRIGSSYLAEARRQQKQLSYFTQSCVQDDLTQAYLDQWVNRKYANSDDYFLNWVKSILKEANFMAFFKHHRLPLASSRLVNDRIKPDLERVFHAEDSYFKYTINNKIVEKPEEIDEAKINDMLFNAMLFRFNDILVSDLNEEGNPITELIEIENVVAIDCCKNEIEKIAYCAEVEYEGVEYEGYLFIDDKAYSFYKKESLQDVKLFTIAHNLGYCPAHFVTRESFNGKKDVVRKSIFSYVREEMEEYSFLHTLLKMTQPNGVIPIVTMLKAKKQEAGRTTKLPDGAPQMMNSVGGQNPEPQDTVQGNSGSGGLQAGTIYEIPPVKLDTGGYDMEVVKNYVNFYHLPIEPLKYIEERIKQLEDNIVSSIIGVVMNQNDAAKNELQVESGFVTAEDKLRSLSLSLSSVRKNIDFTGLALKYDPKRVTVDVFYGSKFYLDSLTNLYKLFSDSPNNVERRNILIRISTIRNKFNLENAQREKILYSLLPYAADVDFKTAIEGKSVDQITFQIQTRFDYWINHFEASYGDLVAFWNGLGEMKDSEKLLVINNLIIGLIEKEAQNKKITPEQNTIHKLGQMSDIVATSILEAMSPEQKMGLINMQYIKQAIVPQPNT